MIEFRSTLKGEREFMRKEIEGVAYDTSNSTVDKKFTYGVPGDPCGYEDRKSVV